MLLTQKELRTTVRPDLIEEGTLPSLERRNAVDQADDFHPEVLAFARWFAEWWLRRGCDLAAADAGDDSDSA